MNIVKGYFNFVSDEKISNIYIFSRLTQTRLSFEASTDKFLIPDEGLADSGSGIGVVYRPARQFMYYVSLRAGVRQPSAITRI